MSQNSMYNTGEVGGVEGGGGTNIKGSKFNSKSISWAKLAEDSPCH